MQNLKSKTFRHSIITNHPLLTYTFAFAFLSVIVFSAFFIFDKSFIYDSGDAKVQHYPALVYVGQWGRRIIKEFLFNGKLSVPLWDFSIGYGADVLTTFNYYSIGDPLNIFAIITPTAYIEYLYAFLILLRMYLSGIGFYLVCRYFKISKNISLLTALLYAFNFFSIRSGTMHIFFLNATLYLPFVILGAEKIFNKEKPFVFIFSVFFFTISNFYFAYILILITIVYVLVRFFCSENKKTLKSFISIICNFLILGLIGICLSAFILLPVVSVYLNSTRSSASSAIPLFYRFSYYERFVAGFLGDESDLWRVNGYHPLGLLSVFYIFTKPKQHKTQKALFVVFTVFLCIPIFGYIFNGFIYPSNRFGFAYHFLLLFIAAYNLKDIINSEIKVKVKLCIIGIAYLAISTILCRILTSSSQSQYLIFAFITFILVAGDRLFANNPVSKVKSAIAILSVISICTNSVFYFYPTHKNYISDYITSTKVYETLNKTSTAAFKEYLKNEKEFSRLQTEGTDNLNTAVFNRINSTGYYFSYCADNVPLFNIQMEAVDFTPYRYYGVDKSAFLAALSSIKHYSASGKGIPPYNYKQIQKRGSYTLYANDTTLPLGYTYDSYLTPNEYENLSAVKKREAIIQNVLLEEDVEGLNSNNFTITSESIPYNIEYSPNIIVKEKGIFVKKSNSKITLNFNGKENCETYVSIKNFNAEHYDSYELSKEFPAEYTEPNPMRLYYHIFSEPTTYFYIDIASEIRSKEIIYCSPDYRYYNGIHDYTVNMGYSEKAQNAVTINFPVAGFYSWDSINITCQPMDNYKTYVDKLSENILENVEITDNQITGSISLDSKKILCLSVPYSKGWTAYVDGKKTEILPANTWSMAIILDTGNHTIKLEYFTPGMKLGIILSLMGLCSVLVLFVLYKVKKEKSEKPVKEAERKNL